MQLIGHENTKKQIKIAMNAAHRDNRGMPHIMFAGAAGCGKTSMARKVAADADVEIIKVSPDDFKTAKTIRPMLEKLNHENYNEKGDRTGPIKPSIIFIDEIHRMPIVGQEVFGIAMEEFELESDRAGKKYWIPYFTVIGATTNDGILSKPFRDRFKVKFLFEPYSEIEIQQIIALNAERLETLITPAAIRAIAKRSRGIPRITISYFERVRDVALDIDTKMITTAVVHETFEALGIDDNGLTRVDLKILNALFEAKVAVGLENLSIITNEATRTIMESAEPFLIQRGFMLRGGKGRQITEKGIQYLEAQGGDRMPKVDIDADYVRK